MWMRLIERSTVLVALMIGTATAPLHARPVQETVKILMLYAYDPNAPGVAAFAQQLKVVVSEQFHNRVEIYDEYLDLNRFPGLDRSPQLARYFAKKYQGFRPDAIVAEGTRALMFATERLRSLFPGVPIVYGHAFEPILDLSVHSANVTGRRQPLPFVATYSLARALQPEAERVVIVSGASEMDSLLLSVALREITPLLNGMELEVLQDWSYESLIDSLRRIPPRTFVIFSSFSRDRHGRKFIPGDLIASLAGVTSVPVYGIARNWVGDGVVGGGVMDFADDGRRTGHLLVRVLRRAPGEPMPPAEVAATPLVVDWRQLQRWGLSENRLPPDTEVLFRTPSVWERYRSAILSVLGVITFESLLIGLLLMERKRRMRAQRAVEERAAYDRMMAALVADTVRRSPVELSRALEDALRRVGRFAGARAAALVVNPDDANGAATRLFWTEGEDGDPKDIERPDLRSVTPGTRLEIPLVAEGVTYGVLELRRARETAWPAALAARLGAVGDFFARVLARARAGRALEETRAQVEHMGRVATVSGLAAAVSHELGQPLTAIRMNAEAGALLLARTPPEVDEARLAFKDIASDDLRASQVIENFRALLRKQEPVSATVDLNGVCRDTARLMQHEATIRQAKLVLTLDPDVPLVRGDPVQLQQVVINLTLNALDAVSASTSDRDVVLGTARSNGKVEVYVHDTGPGLPPDLQPRLFEPFFSTKPHGLGMGLTIVRTIVERHHGGLRAENRSAGGALFTVTLPADEAGVGESGPSSTASEASASEASAAPYRR